MSATSVTARSGSAPTGKGVAAARAASQPKAKLPAGPARRTSAKTTSKSSTSTGVAAKSIVRRASSANLTVVTKPAPERISTGKFAAFVFIVVVVGLGASLALNTALGSGAFELATLQQRHADLMDAQQQAAQRLATLETPASLAKKARALGMMAATGPAFLSVDTGAIVGAGVANPIAKGAKPVVRPVVPVRRALIPVAIKAPPAVYAQSQSALAAVNAVVVSVAADAVMTFDPPTSGVTAAGTGGR
jgi:hypothetical protein